MNSIVMHKSKEALNFYQMPMKHWIKIRTTNIIERSFVEVRRRTRAIPSFKNKASCERILFAIFNYYNVKWKKCPDKLFALNI
ncbi:MAG: transposase [Candidatus Hydrogenedentota bacterium]